MGSKRGCPERSTNHPFRHFSFQGSPGAPRASPRSPKRPPGMICGAQNDSQERFLVDLGTFLHNCSRNYSPNSACTEGFLLGFFCFPTLIPTCNAPRQMQPSGSHPAAIRRPSAGHPAAIRQPSAGHPRKVSQPALSMKIKEKQ